MVQIRAAPLSSPGFWSVALETGAESAFVRGFDQWKAFGLIFHAFAATFMFGLPILIGFLRSWLLVVGSILLIIVVAIALAQFFRFKVEISKAGIQIRRSWAGIPYQRLRMDLAFTVFEPRGMGDWGEDESWPIRRLCEVIPKERRREDILIGTSGMADKIADFLSSQKDRFLA